MSLFKLQWEKTQVQPFHSAVTASLFTVVGCLLMTKTAVEYTHFRMVALFLIGLGVVAAFSVLMQIRSEFKNGYQKAIAGDSAETVKLNGMVRMYRWGNVIFFLITVAVWMIATV